MTARPPLPVLVLTGPTAAGKTDAAVHVAHLWGATLVSADAMQVYRGLDIGTGKAHPAVLRRFPHRCVDVREPDQDFSAGDFVQAAREAAASNERVIVVGGTIFYIRAFLYGLVETPPVDPELRARLEALEDPWASLREVDPELAARLHPNDRVRIIRGLEVWHGGGEPLSRLHARHREQAASGEAAPLAPPSRVLWLDRDDLYERIDRRVERMMERGYLCEVERLLARGVSRHARPMRSLGYRYLADHLLDGLPLPEAVRLTKRDTRHFARKQRGWSRRHPDWARREATDRRGVLGAAEALWGPPLTHR